MREGSRAGGMGPKSSFPPLPPFRLSAFPPSSGESSPSHPEDLCDVIGYSSDSVSPLDGP